MLGRTGRSIGAGVLLAAGVLAFMAAVLAVWAYDTVFTADRFAAIAVEAVEQEEVKAELVRVVTDQVIAQRTDLITARPLLEIVVSSVISSGPFRRILTTAALDAHRTLFTTERTVILDVSDLMTVVIGGLRAFDPALAERVPPNLEAGLLRIAEQNGPTALVDAAEDVKHAAFWLPPLALLLLAAGVALAPSRRTALTAVGIALIVGAVLGVAGHEFGRRVLVARFEDPEVARAAGSVYETFTHSLVSWLGIVGVGGVILAAAASATVAVTDSRTRLAGLRRRLINMPVSRVGQLAYAAIGTVLGLLLLFEPTLMLVTVARLAGLLALYLAGTELLRLTGLARVRAERGLHRPAAFRFDARPLAGAALAVVALIGGIVLWVNRDALRADSIAEAAAIERCNGHAELCDRPLNEVAFAATHNSMSAARERGWYFASHDGGIRAQLEAGFRGLLIDTHFGYPGASGVSTDLSDTIERRQIEAKLDPEMIAAGQRLSASRTRVAPGTAAGVYLCHGFCELGATPLDLALGQVRDFLRANPHEVLIIFVEDYVEPADMEASFIRSRLIDDVYTHTPGAAWPTLRELIEREQRVLVLSENVGDKPAPAWYHNGFALAQETPFSFKTITDFSCRPNRGQPDSPLFQINHWLEKLTPLPGDSAAVNAYEFLLARARLCQQERGRIPNIVAVNFYEIGDALRVVDTLNGVGKK